VEQGRLVLHGDGRYHGGLTAQVSGARTLKPARLRLE
jgi:hypothetical protein